MDTILDVSYLEKLSDIVQTEGIRDQYVLTKRLKELNQLHKNDIIIYESYNQKGKCIIFYGLESDPNIISSYEFTLGRVKKNKKIKSILHLDKWEKTFGEKVRDISFSFKDLEKDICDWVNKYSFDNPATVKQFLNTLQIYNKFTGQLIISYYEFNGELHKIKPVIRYFEEVSLEELYSFAKEKSLALWNREFNGKIEFTNTYWKNQLGLYSPTNITIYFSKYKNSCLSQELIYDTMVHEMVHWHLHTSDRNYKDEDFEFIEECLKVGCSLSDARSAQRAFEEYELSLLKDAQ